LPALLQKIKSADQTVFQKYFGQHGLNIVNANEINGIISDERGSFQYDG
jgi:hypothetical protein